MSSMSVYGIETGEIDINTIPNPKSMYAKTKLQVEKEISKLSSDSFKIVVVRPPMVYGEGCKGNYPRLKKLAEKLPIFPTYRNKRSMISIDNLCAFFKDVIINEKEGLFLPQDDEYVCTIDMMKKMRNRKVHSTCLFNWLIWILVKINRTFKKVFGNLIYKR